MAVDVYAVLGLSCAAVHCGRGVPVGFEEVFHAAFEGLPVGRWGDLKIGRFGGHGEALCPRGLRGEGPLG